MINLLYLVTILRCTSTVTFTLPARIGSLLYSPRSIVKLVGVPDRWMIDGLILGGGGAGLVPLLWLFVDSAGYLRLSRPQTMVVCGLVGLSGCVLYHRASKRSSAQRNHRRSCALGVVWRPVDPGAVRPRGSPGASLDGTSGVPHVALPPGWRVVVLKRGQEICPGGQYSHDHVTSECDQFVDHERCHW